MEKESGTLEQEKDVVESYFQFLKEANKKNLDLRDQFVYQQTIGFCELFINTGTGLIGAIGIATLIGDNLDFLTLCSLMISVFLILVGIIIAILLRRNILKINREISNDRATIASELMKSFANEITEGKLHSDHGNDFQQKFRNFKEKESKMLKKVKSKLSKNENKTLKYLSVLELLLFLSILFIAIGVVFQVF